MAARKTPLDLAKAKRPVKAQSLDPSAIMQVSAEYGSCFPDGLKVDAYKSMWGIGGAHLPGSRNVFHRCRQLYQSNDLVGFYVDKYGEYITDGIAIAAVSDPMKKWVLDHGARLRRIVCDMVSELLLCDNAVIFWKQATDTILPLMVVLNCEQIDYANSFGTEVLRITPPKMSITADQARELGERYAAALREGVALSVDHHMGDSFRIITSAKWGEGLAMPKLYRLFGDLSLRELLRTGEWNGAWLSRDVIRKVTSGHEIKSGPLAGQALHFLKPKGAEKIKANIDAKTGAFTAVGNFDLAFEFIYLDPKFFSSERYAAVQSRIDSWLGPLAPLYHKGSLTDDQLKALGVQCRAMRAKVAAFFAEAFNHEEFIGGFPAPPEPIQVTFSETTFLTEKEMLDRVMRAQASGICSTTTARAYLGFDSALETERLAAEHRAPLSVTPVFEAKQGMRTDAQPGRPSLPAGSTSSENK